MSAWTSPWDGGDRRVLRAGIAVLAVFDVVYLVRGLVFDRPGIEPNPEAPAWVLTVAASRPLLALSALVVVWCLLRFARGRHALLTGSAGLLALAVVAEAYAATHAGPYRANFFSGAMLLGWLAGEAVVVAARRRGEQSAVAGRAAGMRWGEAGAVGALAATYVGAGMGKLLGAGWGWADGTTLRAVIRSHAPVGEGIVATMADAVASHPAIATVLSIATLGIQLGALAYPWNRRSRALVGVALVGFHVGVALTTRIGYWQPVVALVLFSLPWPRWIRPLRRAAADDAELETLPQRVAFGSVIALVIAAAAAWTHPWRDYTRSHHRAQDRIAPGDGSGAPARSSAGFGPFAVGDALDGGWSIDAIDREPHRARLVLSRDEALAIVWLSPREPGQSGSPYDTDACHVAYGETATPLPELDPALRAIMQRVDASAQRPEDVAAWLAD